MAFRRYSDLLRIWETNFGRDAGWILKREGETLAVLTDSQYHDMFWESYQLEIVATDAATRQVLITPEFWTGPACSELTWHNRLFDLVPLAPLPAGLQSELPGRLIVRGLYLLVRAPWQMDRLVLWVRRRQRLRRERLLHVNGIRT